MNVTCLPLAPTGPALLRPRLRNTNAILLSAVLCLHVVASQAQTTWQVQQIPTSGYVQNPFTDGKAVVWNDAAGVHKYVDGVKTTLAASGRMPVVDGDKFAWITQEAGLDKLFYDDGSGPQVIFSAQPATDPLPRISDIPERPCLVGSQLAFNYGLQVRSDTVYWQIGLFESGTATYPLNPQVDINVFGGSFFPSTNGSRVVWTTEYQTGQEQVFQWADGVRSAISPVGGGGWAITTDDFVFYTAPISGTSSQVVRYTYESQATEAIGTASWVEPRAQWAAGNRAVFTGLSGDLTLWDTGTTTVLGAGAWANVSEQNLAWIKYGDLNTEGNRAFDVLVYDGQNIQNLGSYFSADIGLWMPLSVSDQIITWTDTSNLYVAAPVPEPATYVMAFAGLACAAWAKRWKSAAR
jgi:hypothetical protein